MKKIGFVGAGNMAGALIKGLLRAGQYAPDDVWVSDPVDAQLRRMKRLHKVEFTRDNHELVRHSQTVVLAVKPQIMASVLEEIRAEVNPRKLFISIAAGFPLRRLETGLGGQARVVRVMPNTPVLVGRGVSVAVAGTKATPADLKHTLKLFKAVGEAVSITGEDLLDAVTALSGSGPAFVYLFAEGLIEGGIRGGLSQTLATQLAYATLGGAAAMLVESGLSSRELRDMVTSPGGTTLAGLSVLDSLHFRDAIIAAVEAATRRARELAAA
ncbi:MAG TPA: pyrroline-5-carboxylate reductase [Candidatus Binatia bacterium]|jgi:pyrroline-5-carboxylate reductase|nr:pyrroline-5-carboxylate reductase [Candidatus Binatia bacterium]